jgi:hypothetical protein
MSTAERGNLGWSGDPNVDNPNVINRGINPRRFKLLIENATQEVHDARKRHHREMVERTRLRRLVERVDEVISACEEIHLQSIKETPADLKGRAEDVFAFARSAVSKTGDREALAIVEEAIARRQIKITEIMDILWTIQEIVFDLMLPWRTELPEDVEPDGPITGAPDWRRWTAVA